MIFEVDAWMESLLALAFPWPVNDGRMKPFAAFKYFSSGIYDFWYWYSQGCRSP